MTVPPWVLEPPRRTRSKDYLRGSHHGLPVTVDVRTPKSQWQTSMSLARKLTAQHLSVSMLGAAGERRGTGSWTRDCEQLDWTEPQKVNTDSEDTSVPALQTAYGFLAHNLPFSKQNL